MVLYSGNRFIEHRDMEKKKWSYASKAKHHVQRTRFCFAQQRLTLTIEATENLNGRWRKSCLSLETMRLVPSLYMCSDVDTTLQCEMDAC
mmetsp:Transcript_22263/g.32190  ORF Transcript_22263/g.32190 Transcript_22263/m.32190 type:complete len:90 (+) Transcript_22263:138-407(+)